MKVVELASIGPGPHACTLLADLGADIIRIDRPGGAALTVGRPEADFLARGRPSVALDLKHPRAAEAVLDLISRADVLVEGFRPGVAERLGLGPAACLARNPALVYGRMTGWGQTGPWKDVAGHDLTYIAVNGVLDSSGQDPARPHFAQNVVGDFGGGSLYLVAGILAALLESRNSGEGQVVDAAIIDGSAHLNMMWSAQLAAGVAREVRGCNYLDGGVPNYRVYDTSDSRHVAVAALEPEFNAAFLEGLGLTTGASQVDVAAVLATRTRDEWADVFDGTDACVAPVLRHSEAIGHPHVAGRAVFVESNGLVQPAPAPRFSRTEAALGLSPHPAGTYTRAALTVWGVDPEPLIASGAAVQS